MEWLERQRELLTTDEISVVPNGKYWNVKDVRAGMMLELITTTCRSLRTTMFQTGWQK